MGKLLHYKKLLKCWVFLRIQSLMQKRQLTRLFAINKDGSVPENSPGSMMWSFAEADESGRWTKIRSIDGKEAIIPKSYGCYVDGDGFRLSSPWSVACTLAGPTTKGPLVQSFFPEVDHFDQAKCEEEINQFAEKAAKNMNIEVIAKDKGRRYEVTQRGKTSAACADASAAGTEGNADEQSAEPAGMELENDVAADGAGSHNGDCESDDDDEGEDAPPPGNSRPALPGAEEA